MKSLFIPGTFHLVLALGTTCTIGYGTVLYSFSLLSIEIENAFNWSNEFIFGVYSFGVLLAGLVAARIGRILDQHSARIPMCMGSVLVAISLAGQAQMTSKAEFIVFMLLMEAVSILVIYESAFVALTQAVGKGARKPISQITLIAGFASTIFWPVIAELLKHTDWRGVYLFMALLHILVCLPLHWIYLKPRPSHTAETEDEHHQVSNTTFFHDFKTEIFIALAFGLAAFCIVGLQIHIFAIFGQLEVNEKIAIVAGSLIGPFQVISRLTDMILGRYINAYQLGLISLSAMALGLLFMLLTQTISPSTAFLFAVFFGVGQGLTNIVRGALPLQLFGALNYGAITGRMNRIRLFMTAIAPISFAFMLEAIGVKYLLILLLSACLMSYVLLKLATERHRLLSKHQEVSSR